MGIRKIALITRVSGQDGSFLSEFLLHKGYIVHGVIRRISTICHANIAHIEEHPRFHLQYADLSDIITDELDI